MLLDCLKKLGKGINSTDRAELESAFNDHSTKGLSEYDASIAALTDYHKGLFDSANELRVAARLPAKEYKPFVPSVTPEPAEAAMSTPEVLPVEAAQPVEAETTAPTPEIAAKTPSVEGLAGLSPVAEKSWRETFARAEDLGGVKGVTQMIEKDSRFTRQQKDMLVAELNRTVPARPEASGEVVEQPQTSKPYSATVYRGVSPATPVDEGMFGKGEYWTTDPKYAKNYGERGIVKQGTVSLQNPLFVDHKMSAELKTVVRPELERAKAAGMSEKDRIDLQSQLIRKHVEELGHDGMILKWSENHKPEVVVFYPEKLVKVASPLEQPLKPEVYPPAPKRPADWITKPLAEQKRILEAEANQLNEQSAQTRYSKPYADLTPEQRRDVVRTKFRMSVAEQSGMTEAEKNVRAGIPAPPPLEQPPETRAKVETPQPEPSITSARKEMMKGDRAELDLPELPAAERKSWQTSLDNAKDKGIVDRATTLADEVLTKPRALNDEETAGLVLRAQMVKNRHARVMEEIGKASDPDVITSKRAEAESLEREFDNLTRATKASGTEKGRALAAQKLTINQDYDLVSVVQRMKAAKGRELTTEERTKYEAMVKERDQAILDRDAAVERAHTAELQRHINRAGRQRKRAETKQVLDEEAVTIRSNIVAEFMRLKGTQSSTHSLFGLGNLDPEGVITKELVKYARNRVKANVGLKAEALIDDAHNMVKEFGVTRRQVAEALSGYMKPREREIDEATRQLASIRSEIKSLLAQEDVVAGVRTERQQGPKPDFVRRNRELKVVRDRIGELKSMVDSGVHTVRGKRERVPDAELEALRSERTALTEAVKALEDPNADQKAIDIALRAVTKSVAGLEGKIKSGDVAPTHRTVSPWSEELGKQQQRRSELQKQIADMRKANRPATDGAQRRIEQALRATNKSIEDLEGRIKRGETRRPLREGAQSAYSPEIAAAKKAQAELQKTLDEMRIAERKAAGPLPPKQGPPRRLFSRNETRLKQLEAQEKEWQRKLDEREFGPRPKKAPPLPYTREVQAAQGRATRIENEFRREADRADPRHWLRDISGIRKSGMLSGYWTHIKNIAGTGLHVGFEEVRRLPSVVMDAALQGAHKLDPGTFSGARTVTVSPSAMLDGVTQALTVGGREAKQILKHGAPLEQMEKQQFHEINTGVKVIDTAFNSIYRFMSASDRIFYQGSYKRNLVERAQAQAKTEGGNWRERARELTNNPDAEMDANAKHDALVATFNNSNVLSNAIKSGRGRLGPVGNFAVDMVLPFDRTPTNVIARVIEASPGGYAKNAKQIAMSLWRGKMTPAEQRAISETFGRATTGTSIVALGFALAAKGLLTTDDYGSTYLEFRGRKINLSGIAPTGTLLSVGAGLQKQHANENVTKRKYAGAILKPLVDQPVLRASSQVSDVVKDPDRGWSKAGANLAFSFVPMSGAVRAAGQIIDPAEKRYADQSFKQQFQRNVPIWRQSLSVDRGRIFGPSPTKGSDELERLNIRLMGAMIGPDETPEDYAERKRVVNYNIQKEVNALTTRPAYDKMSDEEKAKAIREIPSKIANAYRAERDRGQPRKARKPRQPRTTLATPP